MNYECGSLSFMECTGVVVLLSTSRIEQVENPALVPATVTIPNAPTASALVYRGWFSASKEAAVRALQGSVISVRDENRVLSTVKVTRSLPVEQPALDGDTSGYWVTATLEVIAWA